MTRFQHWVIVWVALASVSPALAQGQPHEEYRGTPEQQAACRPDALKLCGPEIPNVERITQCLRYYNYNKKLSPECAAVFAEKRR
jgi:hypothetical protein